MRVRLEQQTLIDELVAFLGRCNCRVQRLAEDLVDVLPASADDVQAALRLVQAGLCYRCGAAVAPALGELGSVLCHDCRDAGAPGGAALRSRWSSRLELEGYLKAWNALHPDAGTTVLDAVADHP